MKNNKKKGFTIVELVIVIAVIGILSAVLIPTFSNVTKNAKKAALDQELKGIVTTITQVEGGDLTERTYYFKYDADGKAATSDDVTWYVIDLGAASLIPAESTDADALTVTKVTDAITAAGTDNKLTVIDRSNETEWENQKAQWSDLSTKVVLYIIAD